MPYVPKVLIVDDNHRMCESLKELLSNQSYVLETCSSGKKAIEYLNTDDFNLVILDMVMPDMNGHQIMDYISNQSPDTLVIVITGHASIESAIKFIKKGAYDYIRKPFEPEELLTTVKNCLDNKRLESENEAINARLIRTDECYRYLVQNSPDIIYILDAQGNFKFISNTAERVLGFQIEQLIGEHYTTLIHDDDLEKAKWSFNERRTGDRAASQMELRLNVCDEGGQFKDCKVKHLTIELKSNGIYDKPVKKEDTKFIGTHGVIRDISDRKQIESQLKRFHKMEALGTLTGGIAHGFNNILGIILDNAELALEDVPELNAAHFNLEEIKTAGLRAKNVVRQLSSFIRETGIKPQPISIIPVIKDALKFLRTVITANIDIRQNIQDTADAVLADPTQINQIMINLCTNASHAMEETGGILNIGIQNVFLDEDSAALIDPELAHGNYVKVTVSDTGPGIAPEIIERIFDPYFTTKEIGKGSGLGLSVVHGIVKIHRGAITVDSELGQETTFSVFFPVTAEEVVTEPKAVEELPVGNEKTLSVDDEEVMVNMAKKQPQAYDHFNAGYNFYKQRDYNNALAEYNKAIENDPNNNEAYYYRGVIFSKTGENDKALPDFKQSIELDPHHFDSYLYLDWVLAKQRQWDTIISYWNEFIQLEPEHARAYLERGGAYYHQGTLDAALKDAKKSCDLGSSEGCIEYKQLKEKMVN